MKIVKVRRKKVLKFSKKEPATVVLRFNNYKKIKRNIYFENGIGTYIIYNKKKTLVTYNQYDNTAYTLDTQPFRKKK